jgi:hypothetical protein
MTANVHSVNAYSYTNLFTAESGGGKLFVPVQPSMAMYAHFDHVVGVPAAHNQNGVPVSKVRILNTLIDQLVSFKKESAAQTSVVPENDRDIDALIEGYQNKLQSVLKETAVNHFLLPGAAPQTGQLFSIQA